MSRHRPPARPSHRGRTPQGRQGRGAQYRGDASAVVGCSGRGQRGVELCLAVADPAEASQHDRLHQPGLRHPGLIPECLEPIGCCRHHRLDLAQPIGLGGPYPLPLERVRPRRQALVTDGRVAQFGQVGSAGVDVPGREEGLTRDDDQIRPLGRTLGEASQGPLRQRAGRGQVVLGEGTVRGCSEQPSGSNAECFGVGIDRAELAAVLVGLFVVEPDRDLVVAAEPGGGNGGPVGHCLVQRGSTLFEDAPVAGVANQHVVEPQHRLVTPVRAGRIDDLLATEPLENRIELTSFLVAEQCSHRAAGELRADHRCQLDHAALIGRHPFDPRCEQRLDRGWHLDRIAVDRERPTAVELFDDPVVDQHPHQLPHEQWIAFGRLRQAGRQFGRELAAAQQLGGQPFGGRGTEAFEGDDLGHPPAGLGQSGPDLADLRAGETDQRGGPVHPLHEVLEEVEEQRLGPLDVVDHHHDRLASGQDLDQPAGGPERLFRAPRRCRTDEGGE